MQILTWLGEGIVLFIYVLFFLTADSFVSILSNEDTLDC